MVRVARALTGEGVVMPLLTICLRALKVMNWRGWVEVVGEVGRKVDVRVRGLQRVWTERHIVSRGDGWWWAQNYLHLFGYTIRTHRQ